MNGFSDLSEKQVKALEAGVGRVKTKIEGLFATIDKSVSGIGSSKDLNKVIREVQKLERGLSTAAKEMDKGSKASEAAAKASKAMAQDIKGAMQYATGLSLSLGAVLKMLIDAWNLSRRIHGLAMQAAGPLGRGLGGIQQARRAMGDLRSKFRMSYDDAGKLVTQLTRMGVHGEELAGKPFFAKGFKTSKESAKEMFDAVQQYEAAGSKADRSKFDPKKGEWTKTNADYAKQDALYKIEDINERIIKQEKEHIQNQKKQKAEFNKSIKLATTFQAIQHSYGISVSDSAKSFMDLRAQLGEGAAEADRSYGTVLSSFDEIQAKHKDIYISSQEYVATWNSLINKVRMYKTDSMAVLAVYNTLLKKSKEIGLEGVPQAVRENIAKTMMSMPLEMSLGMKAFVMRGEKGSQAENALGFEKLFEEKPGEAIQRVLGSVQNVLTKPTNSGDRAREVIRARGMFEKMGFDKESQVALAEAAVAQKEGSKDIKKFSDEFGKELKATRKSEEAWNKRRGKLIDYSAQSAQAMMSLKELLGKWIEDELLVVIKDIRDAVNEIWAFLGGQGSRAQMSNISEMRKAFGVDLGEKDARKLGYPTMNRGGLKAAFDEFGYNFKAEEDRKLALPRFKEMLGVGQDKDAVREKARKELTAEILAIAGKHTVKVLTAAKQEHSQLTPALNIAVKAGDYEMAYKIAAKILKAADKEHLLAKKPLNSDASTSLNRGSVLPQANTLRGR